MITRPRRFGKTLTPSMLEHFLASEVNGQSTKGLFDALNISQYPKTMKKQGQSPVIFFTLKEVKGKNFKEFFERMKSILTETFKGHRYLLNTNLSEEDSLKFKKILNETASQTDYEKSLKFLSELLYHHTGKKAYILLDEYDTPINDAHVNECYEPCRAFLASMFGKTFKGNNFLEKGIITGILKVAQAALFSDLNNLKIYTTLSHKYANSFGFTGDETNDLLDRAGLPQKAHELKEMYNGYQIGDYTLYNPFSMVSFISEVLDDPKGNMQEALKPYWINTGGTHLITHLIENNLSDLREDLNALLQDQPITTPINEDVIFNINLKHNVVDFWSVLLLAGYLKVVEKIFIKPGRYRYKLLFPNDEIKFTMEDQLLSVAAGGQHKQKEYEEGVQAMVRGDLATFFIFLKNFLQTVPSFRDTKGAYREQFFHGLVLGMTIAVTDTHTTTSSRTTVLGEYDIALEPKDRHGKGWIIELKVTKKLEELKAEAEKGRAQAMKKKYATDMKARGVKEIGYVGIAFCSNELAMAFDQDTYLSTEKLSFE
ncbi:MAG: AAA family ATPase [Bacteroidota bacterium]